MTAIFIIIIILAIAAGIGAIIWSARRREKRRKEMAGWAQLHQMKFLPDNDHSMSFRYQLFQALQRGDNRYAYNIMEGFAGKYVVCGFDYHYQTYSTGNKGQRQTHHHHFSALIVDAGLPLKPLFIRPEGFFDKVTEFIGLDDIDFESDEFSRRFFVKSPDRRWAYDVLHQKTMELLLAYPRFHLDFQGSRIMAYYDNRTFSLGEFGSALKVVTGILDYLPESVVNELRAASSGGRSS